jgi:hypothetical protein
MRSKPAMRYSVRFGNADLGSILAHSNDEACIRAELMAWQHMGELLRAMLEHRNNAELDKEVRHRMSAHFGITAIVATRDGQRIRCRLARRVDL